MLRGGGRGGSRGGGRGGFGGAREMPPMGMTFADLQNLPRESTELYPSLDPLPVLSEITPSERRVCQIQLGFTSRLRKSEYYVVETTKTNEIARYSDKYRPSASSQPTLKRKDLNPDFFPLEILEGYFNPKKKRKTAAQKVKKVNIDDLNDDEDEKSGEEGSEMGSQAAASDYGDEEEDGDYGGNYFENGEADNADDLGDGGGGGDGGGDYD